MAAATGERIVAFGRRGKSLEKPYDYPVCGALGTSGGGRQSGPGHPATEFKSASCREYQGEISDMALLSSKKREARKSVSQPGWITLEGGFAARQCVVQNLSTTGAKVTIDDPNSLPAKLRLAFSRDARTGRRCEVVWRRGKTVGVKFVR
jgi:hypothetical protein